MENQKLNSERERFTARDHVLELIRELAEEAPEMRIGQLVDVIGNVCSDLHGRHLPEASDEELAEAAWKFQQSFRTAMKSSGLK